MTKTQWDTEADAYRAAIGNSSIIVGIKVKHGGQAFAIRGGDDLVFTRVRWLGHSRGIIADVNNVAFRNTRVDRWAGGAALATPGGGPQIDGQKSGGVHNLTIENHTSTGTGDDSLGLFGIVSGHVSGCHIADSFARGILLDGCGDGFVARDNELLRCPLYRTNTSQPDAWKTATE